MNMKHKKYHKPGFVIGCVRVFPSIYDLNKKKFELVKFRTVDLDSMVGIEEDLSNLGVS